MTDPKFRPGCRVRKIDSQLVGEVKSSLPVGYTTLYTVAYLNPFNPDRPFLVEVSQTDLESARVVQPEDEAEL